LKTLDLDPRHVTFPNRCLACGAAPTTSYTLEAKSLHIPFIAQASSADVEVPLCTACDRRKTGGRVGWFVSILLGVLVTCACVAPVCEDALHMPILVPFAAAILVPSLLGVLWWTMNREDRLYHRWFSPVWVVDFDKASYIARLAFKDPRTRREVGVLSGVLHRSEDAGEVGYREHSGPLPVPFTAPPRSFPFWVLVPVGLLCMGAAIVQYEELAEMENTRHSAHLHTLVALLYEVGGKTTVLAVLVTVSLIVVVAGIVLTSTSKDVLRRLIR
jgi:hypothetical protein